MLEPLVIAVPGGSDAVDLLRARLEKQGLLGWVIDGARLGHVGWVLARVAADDEGALAADGDEWALLEIDDLHAELATTWPQAQVGEVVIDGQDVVGPLCQSPASRLHEVAFATTKGLGLDLEASIEKVSLAEARRGRKTLFARVQPIEGPEQALVDVFSTAKGSSVILWRRDPHLVLQVLRRSKEIELHVWEPAWTPVGRDDQDELRDLLRPVTGDAAKIAKVLDLPSDSVVALRALLRHRTPDLDRVCELLGMPDEAARVLNGECAVEDLPGAVVHEPKKLTSAMREAMRPSDDDPAWVRWFDGGARELRPWYVMSSLVTIAFGSAMAVSWAHGGSAFWGVVGVVVGVGSVVDLLVRWLLRRRR